jgi:hypothetical protein
MWLIWLILVGALYAVFHFVWEGILAPSQRMMKRFDLFKMRDDLRSLKLEHPEMTDEAYRLVEDAIHTGVKMLYFVDVFFLLKIEAHMRNDPELKERVTKRRAIVKNDPMAEELDGVMDRLRTAMQRAAVLNSGGWLLYLIPIAAVCLLFKGLVSSIMTLLYVPQFELNKMLPEESERELMPA